MNTFSTGFRKQQSDAIKQAKEEESKRCTIKRKCKNTRVIGGDDFISYFIAKRRNYSGKHYRRVHELFEYSNYLSSICLPMVKYIH